MKEKCEEKYTESEKMGDPMGIATLGAGAGLLLKAVVDAQKRIRNFKPALRRLEKTLRSLIPKIREMEELNQSNGFQLEEDAIREFGLLLQQGEALVGKCLKVSWWNFWKKHRYSKKLLDMDDKLFRFTQLHLQVDMVKDLKQITKMMKDLNQMIKDLNQMMKDLNQKLDEMMKGYLHSSLWWLFTVISFVVLSCFLISWEFMSAHDHV